MIEIFIVEQKIVQEIRLWLLSFRLWARDVFHARDDLGPLVQSEDTMMSEESAAQRTCKGRPLLKLT